MKYHVDLDTGATGECRAQTKESCPKGDHAEHFENREEAERFSEKILEEKFPEPSLSRKTVMKHGVEVIEGKMVASGFAQGFNTREGRNPYFEGSWEELTEKVQKNWDKRIPGTGSVDGDVVLVPVDPEGFHSSTVEVTPENRSRIREVEEPRAEGEKPVTVRVLDVPEKPKSEAVQIVVYRADVLEQDNDRTPGENAEWEVIAIIDCHKDGSTAPMHPTEMRRNEEHEAGGTERHYTEEEWKEANDYWDRHVFANIPKDSSK